MNKKGFTLVELLMAMAFFAFILLFVVAGFIQINRSYTRGVTVRRVQNSARLVVEDIARALRGSDSTAIVLDTNDGDTINRLCIGDLRYGWNQSTSDTMPNFTNEQLSPGNEPFTLVKDYEGSCSQSFDSDTAALMLDENVKVQYLNVESISQTTWRIQVTVSSFEDFDLLSYGQNASCAVGVGDQFCDVASLETVVSTRN